MSLRCRKKADASLFLRSLKMGRDEPDKDIEEPKHFIQEEIVYGRY